MMANGFRSLAQPTATSIALRQRLAEQLAGMQAPAPRGPGAGLFTAAQAISAALMGRRLAQQLAQAEAARGAAFETALLGGTGRTARQGGGPEIQPGTGAMAQVPTGPAGLTPDKAQQLVALTRGNPEARNAIIGKLIGRALPEEEKPRPMETARVVSADSPLNRQFGLGIPAGKAARVKFTTDPATNRTTAEVLGAFGTEPMQTTVNVGGGEFAKELGKGAAEQISGIVERGQQAIGTEDNLRQMGQLLAGGVQTGRLQRPLTMLQGIASDMGVDLASIADRFEINLGELSSKEEFDRLATRVIIDGFEKFKGNLNQKEVELAENAFANLGTSEQANIDAVAAGLAAQRIARDRAIRATEVATQEDARALQREMLSEDVGRFERLKNSFKEELTAQFEAARGKTESQSALPEGLPSGSRQIGQTPDGLPVYETPDGRQLVVE